MDTNTLTFLYGLLLLVLFGWYFGTDHEKTKRWLGTVLTILVTGFCVWAATPPFDIKDGEGKIVSRGKINRGLDLQGGTSFLIKLEAPEVTSDMVNQAMEAIRKRVDQFGVAEPIITPQ